jgi:hypothetical protein
MLISIGGCHSLLSQSQSQIFSQDLKSVLSAIFLVWNVKTVDGPMKEQVLNSEQLHNAVDRLGQQDRESILAACWYVAYADGKLYREVDLLKSIARQLHVSGVKSRKLKREIASERRQPQMPVTLEARRVMLSFVLQVATKDGRCEVVDPSAIREFGLLSGLDDGLDESEISVKAHENMELQPKPDSENEPGGRFESHSKGKEVDLQQCLTALVTSSPVVAAVQSNPVAVARGGHLTAFLLILFANLTPVIGVLYWDWRVFSILVVFWFENVIIGAANLFKLASCRLATLTPRAASSFYLMHYGGFCMGHGWLIIVFFYDKEWAEEVFYSGSDFQLISLLVGILTIAIEHGWLLYKFMDTGQYLRTSGSRLILESYGRVAATHIALLVGGALAVSYGQASFILLVLISIKIVFDVIIWSRGLPSAGIYGRLKQSVFAGVIVASLGVFAGFIISLPISSFLNNGSWVIIPTTALAAGLAGFSYRMLNDHSRYRALKESVKCMIVGVPALIILIGSSWVAYQAISDLEQKKKEAVQTRRQKAKEHRTKIQKETEAKRTGQ